MRVVEPGDLTQTAENDSTVSTNTTGGANGTSSGNASSTASSAAGPTLSIPAGSATPGNPSYTPDTLTVTKGDVITVTNDDTAPHTVTNGASPGDADAGQLFDTSIIMPAATAQIDTASVEAGDHPFHCTVHPFMTGTLTVQ
jgi:plastocyanin